MNEDLEFCEQLEPELPRSREWHRDREWGSVHDEIYFTKEALLKAMEALKGVSVQPIDSKKLKYYGEPIWNYAPADESVI